MIKKSILLFVFTLCSACSTNTSQKLINNRTVKNTVSTFSLTDQFGSYRVVKEIKFKKNKLITRNKIYFEDNLNEPLEVTVAVSKLGQVKKKSVLRPEISQHRVWLEKKKYFSQLKISVKKKKLNALLRSPEAKWNGEKSFDFPKSFRFCFFSQMAECLKLQDLLPAQEGHQRLFYMIWDSYPYHQEQYSQVLEGPFNKAAIQLKKVGKNELQFEVNIGNQVLFYHYDKDYNFTKLFWVAQGLSLKSLDFKE